MLRNKLSMVLLRGKLSMVLIGAVALVVAWAGPADAAKLTIQYQILDGSMDFPFSDPSNPVSGSMTVTVGGSGTTGSFLRSTGPVTLLSFNAATSSGAALVLAAPQLGSGTSAGAATFSGVGGGFLSSGILGAFLNLSAGTINGLLTGTTAGSYGSFGTLSFVGQEISRVLVPEPDTSLLLGLAVVSGLGLMGLRRRS
jgi:hypothetical protein